MSKFLSYKLSFFYYFLSVLIVLLHSNCKVTLNWVNDGSLISNAIERFIIYVCSLGHLAVPTFFIISAFLFYRNIKSTKDTIEKFKKRIKTLFLPYILWNTIFVLIFLFIFNSPISQFIHTPNNLNSLSDIIKAIINSSYTPLWFIKNLLIYICLSPLLFYLSKHLIYLLLTIILSIISVYYFDSINYYSPLYWFPCYLIGILFTKEYFIYFFISDSTLSKVHLILYLLIFIILLILAVHMNQIYIYRLLAPIVIWRLSNTILYKNKIKTKYYWKYSFFIYCVHFFIINVSQKVMSLIIGNSNISYIIIFLSTPFIVIPICVGIASFMEHKMNKCYNILTGNR